MSWKVDLSDGRLTVTFRAHNAEGGSPVLGGLVTQRSRCSIRDNPVAPTGRSCSGMENDTTAELARLDLVERHLQRCGAFDERARRELALARELAWMLGMKRPQRALRAA
jgi:hypothetical protein